MSETAIRDVGESLITLLRSELGSAGRGLVPDPEQIALESPLEAEKKGIRLTLFLYLVVPNGELRNALSARPTLSEGQRPPLILNLYYLLTALPPTSVPDSTDRTLEAHRLLGAAMQVFHDHAVMSGSLLLGQLDPATVLRITPEPMTLEDPARISSGLFDGAYRTSVVYQVTPVQIDASPGH
jgi:hypothetical protein